MKNKNFQTQEDPFSRNAQGISKIYLELLMLMKFLQTKSQIKNLNIDFYDLYYTAIKSRDDNEIENNNENDSINFNDIITRNHYVGNKPHETILS